MTDLVKPKDPGFALNHPELGVFVMWIRYLEGKVEQLEADIAALKEK